MLGQEETSGQEEGMTARQLVMRVDHVTLLHGSTCMCRDDPGL